MLKKNANYKIQLFDDGEWLTVLLTDDYWWETIMDSFKQSYFNSTYRVLKGKEEIYRHEAL